MLSPRLRPAIQEDLYLVLGQFYSARVLLERLLNDEDVPAPDKDRLLAASRALERAINIAEGYED